MNQNQIAADGSRTFQGWDGSRDHWPGDVVEVHGTTFRMNRDGETWTMVGRVYTVTPAKVA